MKDFSRFKNCLEKKQEGRMRPHSPIVIFHKRKSLSQTLIFFLSFRLSQNALPVGSRPRCSAKCQTGRRSKPRLGSREPSVLVMQRGAHEGRWILRGPCGLWLSEERTPAAAGILQKQLHTMLKKSLERTGNNPVEEAGTQHFRFPCVASVTMCTPHPPSIGSQGL